MIRRGFLLLAGLQKNAWITAFFRWASPANVAEFSSANSSWGSSKVDWQSNTSTATALVRRASTAGNMLTTGPTQLQAIVELFAATLVTGFPAPRQGIAGAGRRGVGSGQG